MDRKIVIAGCFLGVTGVIFGAFGAHGLKDLIPEESLRTFETGVRYQMYHALLLLFVGYTTTISQGIKKWVLYAVVLGVVLFSGSIYGLSTNPLTTFNFKSVGFITPIGGLLLISSWLLIIINLLKKQSKNSLK